ncbi:hypothetical protein [Lewinella sp. IMCC34183]|uniref:hypothetical protein n=1 Tax=Lewinella sp. IMCC34183 TaxID=2248762 RepID=UPI000E239915|nr:hypothetical protein [Lewinella sp. IMCC34183]
MVRFIKTTLLFLGILGGMLLLTFAYRWVTIRSIDWSLPDDTHVLFVGASHIAKGVNDSLYEGSANLALGSERYLFTYLKLERLLTANPQVDTVFLEFAPTDMHRNTDSKYYTANEMSLYLPLYFPYFSEEEWKLYGRTNAPTVATLLVQKVLKDIPRSIRTYGRFNPSEKQFDSRQDQHEIAEWLDRGHAINYRYLNKIISLCEAEGVNLIFLYMPMFRPSEFYDEEYYYATYRDQFSQIELLDYSDLELPDNFREDEHHLNKFGARFFTERLVADLQR